MATANGTPGRSDLFAPPQQRLREGLHALLASLDPPLQADVLRALEEEGKLFWQPRQPDARPAGAWSLLPLLIAQHLCPDVDQRYATLVALSVECYICALDLLDDVEDADQTPIVAVLGAPCALNTSTALLNLAQRSLLLTGQFVAPARVLRLLTALSDSLLTATAGQHRDLLAAKQPTASLTVRHYREIFAKKSGALMSVACLLGALCAGVPDEVCEQWARVGKMLGLAHQLDNDAHDESALSLLADSQVHPAAASCSLQVVLATQLYSGLHGRATTADELRDRASWLAALQEATVIIGAWAALERERVREAVGQLEAARPLSPALRRLLGVAES